MTFDDFIASFSYDLDLSDYLLELAKTPEWKPKYIAPFDFKSRNNRENMFEWLDDNLVGKWKLRFVNKRDKNKKLVVVGIVEFEYEFDMVSFYLMYG